MSDHSIYFEKFFMGNQYELNTMTSKSVRQEESGIQKMLTAFPNLSKEELLENSKIYNLENAYAIVKQFFEREYHYVPRSLILNDYQEILSSYISKDSVPFIHIDELLESALIMFLCYMFIWYDGKEDRDTYAKCFRHILFIMHEMCIYGKMPSENVLNEVAHFISDKQHIVELSEDCFWTIMVFTLAHETAHEYIASRRQVSAIYNEREKRNQDIQEEFEADRIAYDIVLKIIMSNAQEGIILKAHTYLAPMMYMYFFDLAYYSDRVLYGKYIRLTEHPHPIDRVSALFSLANDDKYDFNTSEGNDLFNCFLDAYDLFRNELLLKKERGKLSAIIDLDKRNK